MKKSSLLSVVIAMTTVAAADVAYAAVPPVDRAGKPALSVCPAGVAKRIFHAGSISILIINVCERFHLLCAKQSGA